MANNEAIHGDAVASYIASGDLEKWTVVKLAAARNTVEAATSSIQVATGVVIQSVKSGEYVAVKVAWYALAQVGAGGVTKWATLTPGTGGKLVATSTGGDQIFAIAQEAAGEDEYVEIFIHNYILYFL